jgi:hypothetical protein
MFESKLFLTLVDTTESYHPKSWKEWINKKKGRKNQKKQSQPSKMQHLEQCDMRRDQRSSSTRSYSSVVTGTSGMEDSISFELPGTE